MKKRWLAVLLSAPLILCVGVLVWWHNQPSATRGNFDRVSEGMTRAEVEQHLGSPGIPPGSWAVSLLAT